MMKHAWVLLVLVACATDDSAPRDGGSTGVGSDAAGSEATCGDGEIDLAAGEQCEGNVLEGCDDCQHFEDDGWLRSDLDVRKLVVYGDSVYTIEQERDTEELVRRDLETGQEQWRAPAKFFGGFTASEAGVFVSNWEEIERFSHTGELELAQPIHSSATSETCEGGAPFSTAMAATDAGELMLLCWKPGPYHISFSPRLFTMQSDGADGWHHHWAGGDYEKAYAGTYDGTTAWLLLRKDRVEGNSLCIRSVRADNLSDCEELLYVPRSARPLKADWTGFDSASTGDARSVVILWGAEDVEPRLDSIVYGQGELRSYVEGPSGFEERTPTMLGQSVHACAVDVLDDSYAIAVGTQDGESRNYLVLWEVDVASGRVDDPVRVPISFHSRQVECRGLAVLERGEIVIALSYPNSITDKQHGFLRRVRLDDLR